MAQRTVFAAMAQTVRVKPKTGYFYNPTQPVLLSTHSLVTCAGIEVGNCSLTHADAHTKLEFLEAEARYAGIAVKDALYVV